MLLLGILLGAPLGILLGLVPSFNSGFVLIFASTLGDPYLGVGLILGIDATSSIMKYLSMLNSSLEEIDENRLYKSDHSLILTALVSGITGKFIGSVVGISLLIFLQGSALKLDGMGRGLSLFLILLVWTMLLTKAKDSKLGIISLIASGLLAILATNLPINQPMFVLTSCLFSSSILKLSIEKQSRIKNPNITSFHTGVEIASGFFAGTLSAVLWGLPTSVVCKAIEEDEDKPYTIVSRKAFADSISSALGLTILLAIKGSRSAVAQNISNAHIDFNDLESVGIILTSFSLSLIGYLMFNKLMELYVAAYNITPNSFNKVIVGFTIITLLYLSNGWCIPLIGASLLLNKLIKLANAPKEINLGAISILPLIALF
ncbi:MAG: hypothetical protein V7K97_29905 [Nostoc sp.]|uniref:hypothetical protein n=1 Tax=Nostoc sp. TaxID=1180 RepID=UPI002FFC29B7